MMVQLAVSGTFNFRDGDPRDHQWWRRLRLALNQIDAAHRLDLHKLNNDRVLACLSRSDLQPGAYDKLFSLSVVEGRKMLALLFPWYTPQSLEPAQDMAVRMIEQWKRIWGDPNDPVVAAKIRLTAEALQRGDRGRRT